MTNYIDNKYSKWYFNLINSRKTLLREEYTESHHIIPKSLGGSNDLKNLINLTPREHFIAHLLLTKMFNGSAKYKMNYAFNFMLSKSKTNSERYIPTSRYYELGKKLVSETATIFNKGQSAWNKGISRTQEVKDAISKANKGRIAWNKGKKRSDEDKLKMKEGWERKISEGFVSPLKGQKVGSRLTENGRIRIKEANTGRVAWNKGKKWKKKLKIK